MQIAIVALIRRREGARVALRKERGKRDPGWSPSYYCSIEKVTPAKGNARRGISIVGTMWVDSRFIHVY